MTMTMKVKVAAIKKIIKADAKRQYRYLFRGETCAIGGLARAAGVPDEVLKAAGDTRITADGSFGVIPSRVANVKTIREAVTKKFGLTVEDQEVIQSRNDGSSDRTWRQERILEYVEGLA